MADGWGSFAEGFAGSIPQGFGMYGDLRRLAMQEQQQQLQQQMEQRRMQQMDAQASQQKISALTGIAKVKDPKTRKLLLQTQGPLLGLDPNDPSINALIEGLGGEDPEFKKNFAAFAGQQGISPEGQAAFGALEPADAMQNLLRLRGIESGAETAQGRMAQAQARIEAQQQGLGLSEMRLSLAQLKDQQRLAGAYPPAGYTREGGAAGGAPGELRAIPGGPVVPTSNENQAANFLYRATQSNEAGMRFLQEHPDYLGSVSNQIDQAFIKEGVVGEGPIGQLGGAIGAGVGAIAGRGKYPGIVAGTVVGTGVGATVNDTVARLLTSDEGRQFRAAWEPFVATAVYGDSGKAVTANEWIKAAQMYIPLPSDDEATLATKSANRENVLKGQSITSGRAGSKIESLNSAAPGLVEKGNITDLDSRPVVRNPDGSVSTVRTMSIGTSKGEVLIPTVINGKVVSDEEAIAYYKKTGENFGTFKTPEDATAYAKALHNSEAKRPAVTSALKSLAPQVEQTGEALLRKYRAGNATPQEKAQLGALMRAKGLDFQ